MSRKLTADEYKLRYKAVCVMLAALGYESEEASKNVILANINERIRKAVEAGRFVKGDDGYQPSQEMIDLWDANFKKAKQ